MATIPQGSRDFQAKNPHIFKGSQTAQWGSEPPVGVTKKGEEIVTNFVLQKSTDIDGLNKTERAFWNYLGMLNFAWIGCQCITLKLGFDTRYTPDFWCIGFNGELIAWETKGHMEDDARVKLFTAARMFPWIHFKLVKKSKSGWDIQKVRP